MAGGGGGGGGGRRGGGRRGRRGGGRRGGGRGRSIFCLGEGKRLPKGDIMNSPLCECSRAGNHQ